MAQLKESHRKFLEQPYVGVVTTIRNDGSPHNTVVWVDVDERGPSFNTAYPRTKPRHLEENPRVALTVIDPKDPYKWITIDGRAELTTDGANEQIDKLSEKYTGNPEYQGHNEREQRVSVRILPEHVIARGLD
jgi:PPOX class probable F420-dependent enzyme